MHLATHPERARLAFPPQTPMDPVGDEVLQAEPTEWLAGTAALPNVHSLFEERSLAALAAQGIQRWLGRGGLMQHDGRLGFAPISSLGIEVLSELLAANRGFHCVDGIGSSWLVLHPHPAPSDSSRTAFALSWYRQSWLLDPQARFQAIEVLESRLAAVVRPGRRWTARERAIYAGWSQGLRRLQLAEVGMQIMMALSDRAGSVELAAEDVERIAVAAAFDRAPLSADDIWDAIRAATELQIVELRLGRLGWDPRVIRQSAAARGVERIGPEVFELELSTLWRRAMDTFKTAKR